MSLRRRLVLIPTAIVLVLCVLLLALGAWLLFTDGGLKRAAHVAMQWEPRLQLQQPQGRLLGAMEFSAIGWQQEGVQVHLSQVRTRLNPACLLTMTICLQGLQLDSISVQLDAEEAQSDPHASTELATVSLPVELLLTHLSINKLLISSGQQELYVAHQLALQRLLWRDTTLNFKQLQLTNYDETVAAAGKISLHNDYPITATIQWAPNLIPDLSSYLPDDKPQQLALDARLGGSLRQLQADFNVRGSLQAKGRATLATLTDSLPFSVSLQSESPLQVMLPEAPLPDTPLEIDATQLQLSGDINALDFSLAAKLQLPVGNKPLAAAAQLTGSTDYRSVIFESFALSSEQGRLAGSGRLHLADAEPSQFTVAVSELNPGLFNPRYPGRLNFNVQLSISELGAPVLTGSLDALNGELSGAPLQSTGSVSWSSEQRLHFDHWHLASGSDSLQINGQFPDRVLAWHIDVDNLQRYLPAVTGSVSVQGNLSGSLAKPGVDAQLTATDLHYAGYQVATVSSQLQLRQFGWQQSALKVQVDKLLIPGIEQAIDARLQWQAHQQGSATALLDTPLLKGASLVNEIQLQLQQGQQWHSNIQCSADLALGDYALNSRCDDIRVAVNKEPWSLPVVAATDQLQDSSAQTTENADQVDESSTALAWSQWRNTLPLVLDWQSSPQQLQVEPFCLRDGESALCLAQALQWQAGPPRIHLSGSHLPLAWLQAFTVGAYRIEGDWAFSASLQQAQTGSDWQLQGQLAAQQSTLAATQGNASHLRVPIENTALQFAASPGAFNANYTMQSSMLGKVNGTLDYAVASVQQGSNDSDATLAGELRINALDLKPLAVFFPAIKTLSGKANSDLRFTYQEDNLQLFGDASLADVNVSSRVMPFDLADAIIKLDFNNKHIDVSGTGSIGEGTATIAGSADWSPGDWRSQLNLLTSAVRMEPLPHSYARVESDITLSAAPGVLQIGGTITIPEARIVLNELPHNAVGVSDDTIIEDQALDGTALNVSVDINTVLGDDVKFSGFGLETELHGYLRIKQEPGRLTTGNGVVKLESGRYRAYGQDLLIEEGRMIFAGPLTNPQILLTAIRKHTEDDVRVGVRVTGTAREAELALFSTPAMSEQDKLYYLLTGKGPNSTDVDGNRLAQQTAIALGLAQSNKHAREVGESIGVQDLQVGTDMGRNGEEAQVSGYITPDLYIVYGVSIFDQLSSITARYSLTRNVYVEVYDSVSSAIDVFWAIGRD